jgi:hypothetical protein
VSTTLVILAVPPANARATVQRERRGSVNFIVVEMLRETNKCSGC